MTVSMTELMRAVRNCFLAGAADGAWRVADGRLTGSEALPEGWAAVEGYGAFRLGPGGVGSGLPDGQWEGRVWLLQPPEDFLRLLEDVNGWLARQEKSAALAGQAVTRRRESFGAYAAETAYAAPAADASLNWQEAFADRLRPFRRMFMEVSL